MLLLVLGAWGDALLHAQMTEEEKRTLFLQNKNSSSPTSQSGSQSDHSVHHFKKKATQHSKNPKSGTQKKWKHHHPASSGETHDHSQSGEPSSHPSTNVIVPTSSDQAQTASPHQAAHPAATFEDSSVPSLHLPHGASPSAPITIEKSGVDNEQGLEPASLPPSSSGIFGWLFGASHASYSYLSTTTRAAIDRAPVRRGRWKYIVVHNSGTREGNARVFDIYHLRVRHMKNGLAYQFVIGNGHGSGDGEIEIGHRWTAQLNGGHVASDYLNDIALGICLVGDFNRDLPTKAQIGALEELITYLRTRVGKTQGRQAIIYAHKEINPRPTDCPGDRFPYGWLHGKFGKPR